MAFIIVYKNKLSFSSISLFESSVSQAKNLLTDLARNGGKDQKLQHKERMKEKKEMFVKYKQPTKHTQINQTHKQK
jgi:hypothetical protein